MAEPWSGLTTDDPNFREVLDAVPAAIYATDAAGVVIYCNKAAEELAGRTPRIGADKWGVTWRLYTSDGVPLPLDECPMAVTLKTGKPVRSGPMIAERPDGSRTLIMASPSLLRDAGGRVTGAVNLLINVDAQQSAPDTAAQRTDEQAVLYRFTDRLYRAQSIGEIYDAALDAIIPAIGERASILLFDDQDVMQFVAACGLSDGYKAAVAGHTPWTRGQRDVEPIFISDISAANESESLKATIRNEGIRALAFIPLVTRDGVIGKFMAYRREPHDFTYNEIDLALIIARQLGFAIERERAHDAQRNITDLRYLLSAIVEGSDDAIASKDLNGIINSWNGGAQRVFGYAPEEIIGKSVLTLIPPELQHEEPGIIGQIRNGQRVEHYETTRIRKDGQRIHVSLTVSPIRDSSGRIIGASKIARDITERKRAEEQRTLLINELNHRVKNTLATVQSLAMQTLRSTGSSEEARELFDARLGALARAHDLLTAQNWECASLREVVTRALAPFRTEAERVAFDGPDVDLSPKQALALSIALHELATNAAKYGALSNEAGRVDVSWALAGEHLQLVWRESGGPMVAPPTRTGFGSRLIERNLARELGGDARIDYRPEGVVASITTPLDAVRMVAW